MGMDVMRQRSLAPCWAIRQYAMHSVMAANYEGGHEYVRYERRCAQQADYHADERVTGYEVTYRYRGRLYQTVTDYPPGRRLQVRVDVSPVP